MDKENKKVDGIKKLSREEIIKSRKLVLDAINKFSRDEQAAGQLDKHPLMIDGLFRQRVKKEDKPEAAAAPKGEKPKKKKDRAPAPDFVRDSIAEEQIKEKNSRAKQKSRTDREMRKKKGREARRRIEYAQKLAAEKREIEEQKIKEKLKLKQLRKERAKKFWGELRKKVNLFIKTAKIKTKFAFFKALYLLVTGFVLSILFYLIILVLILRFDLDNNFTRFISNYFPTPAIISAKGIVNYYEYKDFKNNILKTTETGYDNIELLLAKNIIMNNLRDKYKLKAGGSLNEDEIKNFILKKVAADKEINTVGLERIKKIKKLIDKNGDFIQTANKFGDEQGILNISADNEDDYSYSNELKKLNVSDISDIIITPEGYYIFKCYEKSKDISGLSYVFVKAKSLEEYLNEAAQDLKMWSLVN